MTELHITHRTTVTEDQIDHLGHMNVRFYGVAAAAATEAWSADITGDDTRTSIAVEDLYTRHHREQLLGAELEVRSGLLEVGQGHLSLYHELVNTGSDEVAATFVHGVVARTPEGSIDDAWPGRLDTELISPPAHGKPRSISLDRDPTEDVPTLTELTERGLAIRLPRTVTAEECGPDGRVLPTFAPMLHWGGEAIDGAMGPSLHDGPDGEVIGFASMETRLCLVRLPEQGTQIQSFGATLGLADKTMHQVMWVFDRDRGDLLSIFEGVNLAFDTVGRRAVQIPDELRAQYEARLWSR